MATLPPSRLQNYRTPMAAAAGGGTSPGNGPNPAPNVPGADDRTAPSRGSNTSQATSSTPPTIPTTEVSGIPQLSMPHGLHVTIDMGFDLNADQMGHHPLRWTKQRTREMWNEDIHDVPPRVSVGTLEDPWENALYEVGAHISSPQGEPFIQGMTLQWSLPSPREIDGETYEWKWADGNSDSVTNIEMATNPQWVKRVALSPKRIKPGSRHKFKCVTTALFGIDWDRVRGAAIEATKDDNNTTNGGTNP